MSEYQYHEWQAVDRLLTPEEQSAVNGLSSHIDVTANRAVVTYHWSDFRHDPKQVLLKYFDAYFYWANWGRLRLMFRFPQGLLEENDISPYLLDEYITFETMKEQQILDLDFYPPDGGWWIEDEAGLSHFIHLRSDLLAGDYRLLYLAWLRAVTIDRSIFRAETLEPPVPADLKQLNSSLRNFIRFFGLDIFLVQAAAEASPDRKEAESLDYRKPIERLSRAECNEFLVRLAEGDPSAGPALRKRLAGFFPTERPHPSERRTLQQLLKRAKELEIAEKKRQAAEARRKHIAEMQSLAEREAEVWQQVESLLENGRRIASVYDEATALLEKLQQLSEFQNTQSVFRARLRQLAQKFASRPALIGRWESRGWM
ncbi:hypothetical protein [Bellilinea sp.]|uniref:hypothetical protein n=1 Tax=Bellilinea sp. TaxID=2838785 RepID=UPI002ADE01F8|nr:hypothetical protein [Bellilinea sp.]